ncbi:MAG: hypothetical protein HGA63_11440 [Syntrophobacteraceae bacterium]|nr:hypothetical protein [Syntrophobacteraceae bacterium]
MNSCNSSKDASGNVASGVGALGAWSRATVFLLPAILLFACSYAGGPGSDKAAGKLSSKSTFASRMEHSREGDADYPRAEIVNSRFLFAPRVRSTKGGQEHLVLRETIHFEDSVSQETDNGDLLVEAFPAVGATEGSILWKVQSKGISGGIFDVNLYRVVQAAPGGASERALHYSLADGRELFSSTLPVAMIEHAGTREKRYLGFDDGYGSTQPAEISADNGVLGVIYYSSDSVLLHKAVLRGNRSRECRAAGTSVSLGTGRSDTLSVTLFRYEATPTFDGIEVVIDLECGSDGSVEHCRIPINGDSPSFSHATMSAGVRLKNTKSD